MIAVFRADASPVLGGGHVTRCLALADALAGAGWRCAFACNGEAADVVPGVGRHDFLALPDGTDAVSLMMEKWPVAWDLAVVDHYGLDAEFEGRLGAAAKRILVIDDLHDRAHDCDFLLDQTLGRTADDYEGLIPAGCALFLGPDYAILRPEFEAARAETLKKRKKPGDATRLLVTFGATDPHDLTSTTLRALDSLDLDMAVDVVCGGGAPHLGKVRRLAESSVKLVTVHQDADDIADLMSAADLAVGAPGGMAWERCCLGLPSILVTFADNQREIAAGLGEAGAAVDLGWYEEVTSRDLSGAIEKLCRNAERRNKMIAMAAADVCDGRGATRVLMRVMPAGKAKDGSSVRLRFAIEEDGEMMFAWQCHNDTRRFFRNRSKPERGEHFAWLEDCLLDPGRYLCMIERRGERAGVLRLDRMPDDGLEVSIYVAPNLYGKGIASAALMLARQLWPSHSLVAGVAEDNVPSHALFQSGGYELNAEGRYINHPGSI